MIRIAVYGVAALEIGAVLFYMAQYDPSVRSGSGGQEMGLFFDALILAALLPATLVFVFAKGRALRTAAALVVLSPVILMAFAVLGGTVSPILLLLALGLAWWWLGRARRKDAIERSGPGQDPG